ncbi:MAG: OB-fold nucleic acid binding domain-containing protein [Patescibacteria group bacterium]
MTFKIKNARDFVGKEVTLEGWMYNRRGSGKIYFLQLRDGTGFMQGIVTENESGKESMEQAEKLTMETSLRVTGLINKHPKLEDVFEMVVKKIEPLQIPAEEYPISKKEHGP